MCLFILIQRFFVNTFHTILGSINVQKVMLKNKINTEYDPDNLRNLLQQLHKIDLDPMFNILDINYEVSYFLHIVINMYC